MGKNINLLVNSGGASSQSIALDANKPVKIQLQDGNKYILKNQDNDYAPEHVTLKRHGNDLNVILDGDTNPAIVIDDYYVSGNQQPLLGVAEDGQLYSYIATDAAGNGYTLVDEGVTSVALGGSSLGDSSYLFESVEYNNGLMASWPWFLGAAAIGGIGYAIYDNNKDDDSHSSSQPATQTESQPISPPDPQSESQPEPLPTPDNGIDDVSNIAIPAVSGTSTAENKTTIYGVGEAGETITLFDNGQAIGSAVVKGDGQWQFIAEVTLDQGLHNITLTQTGISGSTSSSSGAFSFTVDTVAPAQPVASNIVIDSLSGSVLSGKNIASTLPTFSGEGEPGSIITFMDDTSASKQSVMGKSGKHLLMAGDPILMSDGSQIIGQVTVGTDGKWSFTPDKPLAEGPHHITMVAMDSAGNKSALSELMSFEVDITVPEVPTIEFAQSDIGAVRNTQHNGESSYDFTPTLNGKAEANSVVKLYDGSVLLGFTQADSSGQWSFTPSFVLTKGSHRFTATATDKAGNTSTSGEVFNLVIKDLPDSTDPYPTAIVAVLDNADDMSSYIFSGGTSHTARPYISGVGAVGDTIIIYTQDSNGKHEVGRTVVELGSEWWTVIDVPLLPGVNVFTAIAIDPSGNPSKPSEPYIINTSVVSYSVAVIEEVVDDVGAISGAVMRGEITNDNQPTISGVAPADIIVNVYCNDVIIGSTQADAKGHWSFTPETTLADGICNISVNTTDILGQSTQKMGVFSFEIDTTIPAHPRILGLIDNENSITGKLPLNGDTEMVVTNDTSPQIFGVAKPGSVIEVHSLGHTVGTTVTLSDGSWSFTLDSNLTSDKYTVMVCQLNDWGGVAFESPAFEFIVDSGVPDIPVIEFATYYTGSGDGVLNNGDTTSKSSPKLVGKAESGSLVKIYDGIIASDDGGVLLGMVKADDTGQWSFYVNMWGSSGEHLFTATATDKAGNVSEGAVPFGLNYVSNYSLLATNLAVSYENHSVGNDVVILKSQSLPSDEGISQPPQASAKASEATSTMTVSLNDVLRLGSEELTMGTGNKSPVVNSDESNLSRLDETGAQLSVSQNNPYNLGIIAALNVEALTENTVHVIM
ncbi:Ig-like domain-containing protein [Limnobaculum xujianqingii]|uniref:Ig-like domain-containing protein n=1 Tax=Limnobaculum xujianqingii TaxID=2738837 RepID=UPI00112E74E7|nr:Ig-like domain-containing protein [Limnobaculum xujianqingii]